jgi:hypothetical protein
LGWFLPTILLAAVAVLFWFNPTYSTFYPVCYFHRATGLLCPGCGSLRAIHQLLHGHFGAAFGYNPLLVLSLPLWGWLGLSWATAKRQQRPWPKAVHPMYVWAGFGILMIFGIWRNLH